MVAVPLMLGAGPGHALAPDLLLKPVLVELGATTPTKGLYLIDRAWDARAARPTGWSRPARRSPPPAPRDVRGPRPRLTG